jgi:hypothetical protein
MFEVDLHRLTDKAKKVYVTSDQYVLEGLNSRHKEGTDEWYKEVNAYLEELAD